MTNSKSSEKETGGLTTPRNPDCTKIEAGIECVKCEYPLSEAKYPDDADNPLPCDASYALIRNHIEYVEILREDTIGHPYDCKCLIHR